ncbi:MAG: hypothetical protein DRJ03_03185 [Chloroflexi bacterium]|nr:MAG: hypothetical protein DRJ03_03185 [Chloroflexota bacterium]
MLMVAPVSAAGVVDIKVLITEQAEVAVPGGQAARLRKVPGAHQVRTQGRTLEAVEQQQGQAGQAIAK